MEEFFILIPLLAFMAILYRWICHLDESRRPNADPEKDAEYMWKDVLLFGSSDSACALLRAQHKTCDVVNYPAFPLLSMYHIVVAISDVDLDNLLLCNLSKERNPASRTIAFCNGPIYRELFDQPAVDALLNNRLDLVKILTSWEVLS